VVFWLHSRNINVIKKNKVKVAIKRASVGVAGQPPY